MLKANAYGHGMKEVAKYTEDIVNYFGVMSSKEGIYLRNCGITKPILITLSDMAEFSDLVRYDLEPCIKSLTELLHLDYHGEGQNKKAEFHIKIDTGMNRLGIKDLDEFNSLLSLSKNLKHVDFKGLISHFSDNDEITSDRQNKKFQEFISVCNGYYEDYIKQISSSHSALLKNYRYDMVRLGLGAYGYLNDKKSERLCDVTLKPAMSVYGLVNCVKEVKRGECIGYGKDCVAEGDIKIAVIRAGYADGIKRDLTGFDVIIKGKKYKIIGKICMDMFFADVTGDDIKYGDLVTVLGSENGESIFANDTAKYLNTIPYEILTSFNGRIERCFLV